MKRFKNIAVLLGEIHEDDRILKRAVELATHNQAKLSVYAIFDKAAYIPDMDAVLYPPGDIIYRVKEAKDQKLKAAMESYQNISIPLHKKLLTGRPFISVIHEVMKNGHDLLMLPAEKGKLTDSLFLGSTPLHLLRKCPCAVWVFRAQRKRKFRTIMAAVNMATRRREEKDLNIKIMELASSLAKQEGGVLHIVSCWTAYAEPMLVSIGNFSREDLRRYVRESKQQHLQLLQTFLKAFFLDESKMHIHLPKGEAGDLIPEVAVKRGIDLLVMGTMARSGIPGFLIGNTAEKILNSLPCSVLAVKPDGFISPVKM